MRNFLSKLMKSQPTYDRWYAPETWRAGQELNKRSIYCPDNKARLSHPRRYL